MTDKFTPGPGTGQATQGAPAAPGSGPPSVQYDADAYPFAGQLAAHGVPRELHSMLSSHGVGSLVVKLGIVFSEITAERVVATMPVEGNQQVAGILHGGASAALAETLGSFAAAVYAGPSKRPVGLDLSATHHRPGISGLVTGVCTPLQLGRTVTSHEIVVSNAEGKRLCTARITNMLLDV